MINDNKRDKVRIKGYKEWMLMVLLVVMILFVIYLF